MHAIFSALNKVTQKKTFWCTFAYKNGRYRSGHTTFQRSEICGLRPKTAQRSWQQHRQSNTSGQYSRVQKLASNFEFRTENHPSLAGNVLYINLNVIGAIQIISATLLVISISELKNIEPLPLVHMWKVATEFQTPSFWSSSPRESLTASSAKCFSSVMRKPNWSWTHNRTQFVRKYLFRTF